MAKQKKEMRLTQSMAGEGLENTPLMEAAYCHDLTAMSECIARGADVHERNALGETPLALLFRCRNRKTLVNMKRCYDLLLENKADVNSRDIFGQTPLWLAVHRGDEKAVQLLIQLGADCNIPDMNGISPIDIAKFSHVFHSDLGREDYKDVVRFKGTDKARIPGLCRQTWSWRSGVLDQIARATKSKPRMPDSPLLFARENGFLSIVKLLENPLGYIQRPQLHSSDEDESTKMLLVLEAARRLHLEVLQQFARDGYKLSFVQPNSYRTPLLACFDSWPGILGYPSYPRRQVVAFLLGVAPSLASHPGKNYWGHGSEKTPLQLLASSKLPDDEKTALAGLITVFIDRDDHRCTISKARNIY